MSRVILHLLPLLFGILSLSVISSSSFAEELGRFDRQVDGVGACRAVALGDASWAGFSPVLLVDHRGRLQGAPDGPSGLHDVAVLPGRYLAVAGDLGVSVVDPADSEVGWRSLTDRPSRAVAVGGEPARVVAIGAPGTSEDGVVVAFDAGTGTELWRRAGAYPGASGVAVLPDGTVWITDTDRHRLVRLDVDGRQMAAVGDRGAFPGLLKHLCGH